jgi:hypothetical protein
VPRANATAAGMRSPPRSGVDGQEATPPRPERLLVAVSASPTATRVVHAAANMVASFGFTGIVVHKESALTDRVIGASTRKPELL